MFLKYEISTRIAAVCAIAGFPYEEATKNFWSCERRNGHEAAVKILEAKECELGLFTESMFFRAKFGGGWSVHNRITKNVRARYPNPITRRAYNDAMNEYKAISA